MVLRKNIIAYAAFAMIVASLTKSVAFPITVESCGQSLVFEKPPQRAIISDINMAEMAFSLELEKNIVGLTSISGWYKMTEEFKTKKGNIPEIASKYPTLENIIAINPDFFFAGWNYGMRIGGEVTPETLNKHNIKTLILSESCIHQGKSENKATMNLLYDDILKLGMIFGKLEKAQGLVDQWKKRLSLIQTQSLKPIKVFLFDSGEEKPFTAGKYAISTAIIEAAGGKNITEDLNTSWGTSSWEYVALQDPEFIILLSSSNKNMTNGLPEQWNFLLNHPLMKYTSAVKNQKFILMEYSEITPGPANIIAIEKLAVKLHPQLKTTQ